MNIVRMLTVSLFLAACFAFGAAPSVQAASDQQEVAQRLEINTATAEQLAGLGVITLEQAKAIVELREGMGDLQNYDELEQAGLDKAAIDKLRPLTTIGFMATDCNC